MKSIKLLLLLLIIAVMFLINHFDRPVQELETDDLGVPWRNDLQRYGLYGELEK